MSDPGWAATGIAGSDSPPVWSRDGGEVIFQQTREEGLAQIWAVRPDGRGLRRLTDGTFRAGHPDPCAVDNRLVFVSDRGGSRQVWVTDLSDGATRQLTSGGALKSWPAFSPGCREVLFVEMTDPENGRYDLRVVDVDTGAVRTLLERVRYLGWSRWAADGEWILYYREFEGFPNHLWRIRRDGSGAEPMSGGDSGDYWAPDVSRDGQRLVYSFSARKRAQWGGNADLWLQDLESGSCRRLAGERWNEHGARLSPDGTRVAYWDTRSGYNEIFVMDLATGGTRQLTEQPDSEMTRVAREQGLTAALAHARAHPNDTLASERALTVLLESRARSAEPPSVELAQLLVDLYPNSRRASTALARELFRAGELTAAAKRYLQLASTDAEVTSRLAALALLEQLTGRTTTELGNGPLPEAAVNRLGYTLLNLGRLGAAVDVLGWNARSLPDSANAWDSLGEALYWSDESAAAERAFSRSLELDPSNKNAARFLRRVRVGETRQIPETVLCPATPPTTGRAIPEWATVLEWAPDPEVLSDPELRRRIAAVGAPWRVEHEPSGVEMLLVPPGSYLRGAGPNDPYDRKNERPRHRVEITQPFYLGRYEVTNAEMRRFRPEHDSGAFYRAEHLTLDDDDMPAVDVSWLDATAFADHFDFRLPSEAEWEYAARAGAGVRYPWGNDPQAGEGWGNGFNEAIKITIPEMDWPAFDWDDGFVVSSPAGTFRPNAWGFYDMFGNAWEWCFDAYEESEYLRHAAGATDPVAASSDKRTLRGGGWGNAPRGSGIPYRFGMSREDRHDTNGFRVAREID